MLILAIAVVMGIVRGSWFVAGLPLVVLLAWAAYARLGRSRTLPLRANVDQIDDAAGRDEFARELTHGLNSPAAVIEDGRVTCVNLAWLDFFDWAKAGAQILGMPFTNLVHPQDRERFIALTRAAAQHARRAVSARDTVRPACRSHCS